MKINRSDLDMFELERWDYWAAQEEELVGRIQTIDITKKKVRKTNFFCVQALIKDIHGRNRQSHIQILINEFGTVVQADCDCTFFDHRRRNGGCPHLIQVVNALDELDLDFSSLPIHVDYASYLREKERKEKQRQFQRMVDYSTQEALSVIDEIQHEKLNKLLISEQKELHLQFYRYSSNWDFPSYRCKVGSDKLYAVKNLKTLISQFAGKEVVKFGKNTTLLMDAEALDDQSKKILNFLNVNTYEQEWTQKIELSGDVMDDFCDLQEELDDEHIDFRIQTIPMKFPISIMEEDQIFKVSLNGSKMDGVFYISRDHFFNYLNRKLVRLELDPNNQVFSLIKKINDNKGFYMKEESFPLFYQELIQPYTDYLEIETNCDLSKYEVQIKNIKVYSDMEDSAVRVWGNYQENQKEKKLFEKEAKNPVSIIEAIIMHYADKMDEKNQMAIFKTKNRNLFRFLDEGIPLIQQQADVYVSEELKNLKKRRSLSVHLNVRMNNHLLEIDVDSDVSKDELAAILQSYRRKKSFYRLKNGEIIQLQDEALEQLDKTANELGLTKSDFKKKKIKKPAYQIMHVQDEQNIRNDVTIDDYVQRLQSLKDTNEFHVNEKYQKLLREYQIEGVRWMKDLKDMNLNGILADDMGLGKTLQVLCLLDSYVDKSKPSLIVCPSSLMFNWMSEIEKFEVDVDAVCVNGPQDKRKALIEEKHMLYITTYDYAKRDIDYYSSTEFEYLILDEAQYIKNPKTKNAMSVKSIRARHKLALTGTPIENSLSELWSIFDFLLPGYLFSLTYFTKNYQKPIQIDGDKKMQKHLKMLVSPFILRRSKNEVLKDLPDKVEKELWLDFEEDEKKLYMANLSQVSETLQAQLQMEQVDSILILAMMTRLRQICCEPRMIYDNIKKPSTKLMMCVDLIETLKENNKKVLLFSSFTKIFDWLIEEFDQKGISYHLLTGSTSKEKRKQEVEAFQKDDSDVFLISLKAGGTGLNLTQAQAVIHFDPWWNISAQNQATDRAYRIGQTKNVLVYQLLMKNSIEEKIFEMQKRKKEVSDMFVENSTGSISHMSAEQLKDLFSVKEDEV